MLSCTLCWMTLLQQSPENTKYSCKTQIGGNPSSIWSVLPELEAQFFIPAGMAGKGNPTWSRMLGRSTL